MLRSHTTASSWIINYAKNARMCCLSKNKRGTFQQPRPSTLLHEAKQSRAEQAVLAAQLAQRLLLTTEICGSNPISKIFCLCLPASGIEKTKIKKKCGGGPHCTMNSVLALQPAAPNFILGVPKNLYLDVVEIYWLHCSEQQTEAW